MLVSFWLQLNSWSTSHLEQIDAVQREAALNALLGLCDLPLLPGTSNHPVAYFIHLAGVHSALYTIQTAEIQLRDIALEYLLRLTRLLAANLTETAGAGVEGRALTVAKMVQRLVVQALWPGALTSLLTFSTPIFKLLRFSRKYPKTSSSSLVPRGVQRGF